MPSARGNRAGQQPGAKTNQPGAASAAGMLNRPAAQARAGEKCYWVRFHDKSNPTQPDDVELSVNGEVLTIKRNIAVPLPARFVECARNAVYPQFRQLPNEDRKIVGHVLHYPFDLLGEATPDDFRRMKEKGTQQVLAQLKAAEQGQPQNAQQPMTAPMVPPSLMQAMMQQQVPPAMAGMPGMPGDPQGAGDLGDGLEFDDDGPGLDELDKSE